MDLKDAYFHVLLSQEVQCYVCVRFGSEVFHLLVMLCDICIALQLWTSIMEVCNSIWRHKVLLVYVYFDDSSVIGDDPCACAAARDLVLQTLRDACLYVNLAKSVPDPTQLVHYLGVSINFAFGRPKGAPPRDREASDQGRYVVLGGLSAC